MPKEARVSQDLILSPLGCAFHEPTGALILADLHVGYEATLEEEGFAMPRFQTLEMTDRLGIAIERYAPNMVIVDGDLKHNFDRNLTAEWRGVEHIVDFLSGKCKMLVIRGNHDNYLATILSKRGVHLKDEILIGDIKISHGHRTSSPWDGGMILAHEHPALSFREMTGATHKVPCFLHSPRKKRLVLPAFSTLAIGSDVINSPDDSRMIPLLATEGIDDYTAYGFSGGEILNYRTIGGLRKAGRI